MAITSVGYDGVVNETQWASMIKKVGAAEYGVVGQDDWKVTAVAGADRTIQIAPGKGWGHGVYDESTAVTAIQLDPLASGVRYDLIVMRRDWTGTGGLSTFAKVTGTSAVQIPTARVTGPGVIDEQPIALVQVVGGQSVPGVIRDLRCWAGNGGMTIWHDLCLSYLTTVGTTVTDMGNGKKYQRKIGLDGTLYWANEPEDGYIPLFGYAGTLDGGIPRSGTALTEAGIANPNFLIQAGTTVQHFDQSGYARLVWPKPFPNGLVTVLAFNGDDWSTGGSMEFASGGVNWGSEGMGNRFQWVYAGRGQDLGDDGVGSPAYNRLWCAGRIHRINWIAIGW